MTAAATFLLLQTKHNLRLRLGGVNVNEPTRNDSPPHIPRLTTEYPGHLTSPSPTKNPPISSPTITLSLGFPSLPMPTPNQNINHNLLRQNTEIATTSTSDGQPRQGILSVSGGLHNRSLFNLIGLLIIF